MTYFLNMIIKCNHCHKDFNFIVEHKEGRKEIICPTCRNANGTFEVDFNPSEIIQTDYAPEPIPAPTVTFRSINPGKIATVNIDYDKISLSSSSD